MALRGGAAMTHVAQMVQGQGGRQREDVAVKRAGYVPVPMFLQTYIHSYILLQKQKYKDAHYFVHVIKKTIYWYP